MLKKGLAWHYWAYDKRAEFKTVFLQARVLKSLQLKSFLPNRGNFMTDIFSGRKKLERRE